MRHHALERPAIGTLGLLVVASACSSAEGTPTGTDAGGSIDATTFDAVVPDAGAESGLDSAPDVTGDESIADAPSDVADAGVCTTIALDPTFGTTGEVSTLPAPVGPILVQQADGKLLVIGSAQSIIMVRFATDGHVDTTFGTAGVATTTVSGTIRGAAVQPDGKFVLAGCTTTTTNSVILMRVNADGTPDTTFGSN